MKKTIVSVVIIGAFVIYSFLHAHSGSGPIAVVPNTPVATRPSSSSATATSSATTTALATGTTAPTQTPGSLYKDGSYTGSVDDAQWGVVQVKAVIKNGKITNVQFLQYPSDRDRSVYINSIADPQLTSEAIQAQSANVDIVTGATDSSEAFIQSLTDALSQARA
ncbi:MAG: FMN-binding protein [Chloroflexota bacterium]|nr:FMN-binding protein [Chloroflexota bacterium]